MKPDKKDVDQAFTDIFKMDDLNRIVLDRTMMRNILYYLGEQWIDWFEASSMFGRRYPATFEIPTPVSNLIRDTVKSMKALTLNKEFTPRVWPNSKQQKDKDGAELGEYIVSHLESRRDGEAEDVKELVETWRQITGNGFWRTIPDMGGGMYVIDKNGEAIGNTGDVRTDCWIPFNVVVPSLGQFLRDKSYVGYKSLKEKEWVEDTFKIKLTGGEGDKDLVNYQQQLMTLVANVSPWKGRSVEGGTGIEDMDVSKLVLYEELEWKPTKKYPKGRYAAKAGGEIVINDDKLPLPVGNNGEWEYTVTHIPYNYTPGQFWATSSIDDLISPQNDINEIDQALIVNRKTIGRPYVVTPSDLILKRISGPGSALLAIEYDGRTSTTPPKVERGTPYPSQITEERINKLDVVQRSIGDPKNILRGQTPFAGAAGIAIDTLREAAEQSHTPDIKRFYRCYSQVKRKELMVVQKVFTERRILKVTGPGNEVLVKEFRGADLHNNTDVRLELASGAASTNAGRTEMIMNLLQYGFFDPNNTSLTPNIRREMLKMLGLSTFEETENLHQQRAEYENSTLVDGDDQALSVVALPGPVSVPDPETGDPMIDEAGMPVLLEEFPRTHDPRFRFDPHEIHLETHQKLLFSREFGSLSEERQKLIMGHIDMHEQALAETLKQLRAQQMEEVMTAQAGGMDETSGAGGAGPASGMEMEGAEGGGPPPQEGGFQPEPFTEG